MISYAINACFKASSIDRVIVSTDNPTIQAVALDCGAEAPFQRPADLSGDYLGTMPPMRHAVQWLIDNKIRFDNICCVYPTAPLLQPEYLDQGFQLFKTVDVDYVFSATTYAYPIQRSLRVNLAGLVEMNYPSHFHTRSQDLEETWHDAAQFYWGRTECWLSETPVFLSHSKIVHVARRYVQDIDTEEDWKIAERLFEAAKRNF